jgi:hypothetical protein
MKTWMKYTKRYFINSSIDKYGAASPLFLGQAHVIFAANKITTFRNPNFEEKRPVRVPFDHHTHDWSHLYLFLLKYPHSHH